MSAPGDEGFYASESVITQGSSAGTEAPDVITQSSMMMMASEGEVQAAAADPNLLLRYEFNEGSGTTATDSSGNGYDGSINGGATYSAATGDGSAYCLDVVGSSKYVRPNVNLDIPGSALTLCAWIRNEQSGNSDARVISKASSGSAADHIWMLGLTSDVLIRTRIETAGSVTTDISYSSNIPANTWSHIAVTYDGAYMRHYLNGLPEQLFARTGALTQDPSVVVDIGAQTSNSSWFGGQIDDARIYSRALTAAEVLAIYEGTEEPPPAGDLEGDALVGAGAIQGGALGASSYTLSGDALGGAGEIQSGTVSASYAVTGDSLSGAGLIQSGTVTAAYAITGDSLSGAGLIQSGIVTAAYAITGDSLSGAGLIQSGGLQPPESILLEGDSLTGAGLIQSGTVTVSYTLTGDSLTGSGRIQSGDLASIAYPITGDDLEGSGLIQSGYLSLQLTLTGDSLVGAGLIKDGGVTETTGVGVGVYNLVVRVHNDVGFTDSASFTWEIQATLQPPEWQIVPDRSDRIDILPQPYDMSFYVSSNAGTPILWRLASSPSGFSIDGSSGVVTATASAGVGDHTLRVGVSNSQGETLSDFFQWEILEELVPPIWQTIPPKTTAAEDLSDTYDISGYVTSNSGPLDTWSLITPPTGFTIDQSGLVTAATNVATGAEHSLTAQVFNDEGSSQKAFSWTIDAPLIIAYLHEFNADLGGFTFTRASNATRERYNDPSVWDTVGVDEPVYAGCDYTGVVYAPNAGFTGLVLESASTNYVQRSISHDNAWWGSTNASSTPPQLSVSADFGNIYAATPAIVLDDLLILSVDAQKVSSDDVFLNGYPGGDNGASLPITTTYQRVEHATTNPTQATRGPIIALPTSGQAANITNIQVELGGARNEASSRIISNSGASTTRAVGGITQTLSSMGLSTSVCRNHHAGQLKVYLDFTRAGPRQIIMGVAEPTYAEYSVLIDCSDAGDAFRIFQQVNGDTASLTHNYTWTQGEFIDFRWKVTPTQRLKWWVNSSAAGTDATSVPVYNNNPTNMVVGNISSQDVPAMRVHTLRLQEGEVSDGEILGWP